MVSRLAHLLAHGRETGCRAPAGVFARRLTRAALDPDASGWSARGTVLVTGGTGALGAQVARWLAGVGASTWC